MNETARIPPKPSSGSTGSTGRLMLRVILDDRVTSFPLPTEGALVIGRAADADVVLEHSTISRRHASLTLGPRLQITDLGSANGTSVRGTPLVPHQPFEVRVGDVLELGGAMLVVQAGTALSTSAVASFGDKANRQEPAPGSIVVEDAAMKDIHRLLLRVAASDMSVLLLGETGVGKEVFARKVHAASLRTAKPFLGLNCAALAESLLESELFGHEKGAFTGAVTAKPGLFEFAAGGSVFLDEVGELPLSVQAKLLRVLETREVRRIGGLKSIPIDVRIIAATNRDLEAEIAARTFREDLFFRLNGFSFLIPPLRERTDEIEGLARLFVAQAAKGARPPELTEAALEQLRAYPWPGNIRQLRTVMERAVLLCGEAPIGPESIALDRVRSAPSVSPAMPTAAAPDAATGGARRPIDEEIQELEKKRMIEALEQTDGVQARAAELIQMPLRTFKTKMKRYALRPPKKTG